MNSQTVLMMILSPSVIELTCYGSHFVSGGGQKVAVVSRPTRACPLVPPTPPNIPSYQKILLNLLHNFPLLIHEIPHSSSSKFSLNFLPLLFITLRFHSHSSRIYSFLPPSLSSLSLSLLPLTICRVPPRYYHSVLLAIYRPLSTTLPLNALDIHFPLAV